MPGTEATVVNKYNRYALRSLVFTNSTVSCSLGPHFLPLPPFLWLVMLSCHIAHHCLYICIFVVKSLFKDWLEFHHGCHGPLLQNDTDKLSSTVPGPPGPSGAFQNAPGSTLASQRRFVEELRTWAPVYASVRPKVYQQALLTSAAGLSPWSLCETETFAPSWWCN